MDIAGGTEEVYLGTPQSAPSDAKIIVDSTGTELFGSEVVDSLAGNQRNKAPSVQAVKDKIALEIADNLPVNSIFALVVSTRNIIL